MTVVTLLAPMAGWLSTLDDVPDTVFADRMMGEGLAVEPLDDVLRAPCDATVVAVAATRHAVTLRLDNGAELLIHVGLDTVGLDGDGFVAEVAAGDRVAAGAVLLRFDIDAVTRRARSLVTPMIVTNDGFEIDLERPGRPVSHGDVIGQVRGQVATGSPAVGAAPVRRAVAVPLAYGLHARPAGRLSALAKTFAATISLELRGRSADVRSPVAVMTLGVAHGDEVMVVGAGPDAEAAVAAIAELIASGMGEADAPAAPRAVAAPAVATAGTLVGVCGAPGLALGTAQRLPEPNFDVLETGAGVAPERDDLDRALVVVAERVGAAGADDPIAAAHLALLDDPELRAHAASETERGCSAAAAWRSATRAAADRLRATGDVRLAERAADLRDLENQVLAELLGVSSPTRIDVAKGAILIADELLPSQFAAIDAHSLAGVCTARGGATSHVAILAAAAGIPMVVAAGSAVLAISDGTQLILDADTGRLQVDPDAARIADARRRIEAHRTQIQAEIAAAQASCLTTDGRRIEVFANLGAPAEAPQAVALGAEGCGLLRTEFLFLERRSAPNIDEQATAYQAVADGLGGRPVIIRTLDIGGDKPALYLPLDAEANPALGLRGVRLCLAKPELMRTQLGAVLRVQPPGRCRIMVPMITSVIELKAVRAMLDEVAAHAGASAPELGVMIETPAAAMLADQLAAEADFLSIGTNDLAQYTLAMDRDHAALADQVDGLHPAVLRLIEATVTGARRHGRWVGVCGGLAADPAATAILIGLGVDELSVVPGTIPALKARIRTLDSQACRRLAERALTLESAAAIRLLAARLEAPVLVEAC